MTEKLLTEAAWLSFAKKREDLDDAPLIKLLARWAKLADGAPDDRLKLLDELEAQLKKQIIANAKRKDAKALKEIKDQLNDMLDALERQRKEARKDKSAAEAQADDEAETPALLTTAMTPLVKLLRKGDVQMPALICTAGKETAVLISRRAISPSRRKLLAEAVDAKGGAKYIPADCLFENGALTFVVQSPAAGLAKRLRAALLAQTELRLKVRVRGEQGELDEDGEEHADGAEAANAADGTQAAKPTVASTEEAQPGAVADPLAAAYAQRLDALAPALRRALAEQRGDVGKMRAVSGFASEKAQAKQYAAALQALGVVEKLLQAASAPQQDQSSTDEAGLAAWEAVRTQAITQLKAVAAEIAAARHAESGNALLELNAVIKQMTPRPDSLQKVAELERYLNEDRVVADVCEYADDASDLRGPLLAALARLKAGLGARAEAKA